MPQRAQVTSLEALELFRAQLIVFLTKARSAIEEVSDEVQRTKGWVESDRRPHWEQECRRRHRALSEAEQELFSARLSHFRTQSAAQVLAVERAKRALRQAEDKRDAVKKWAREFENRAQPLVKQAEQLQTFITTDLVKAAAYLGTVLNLLEAYASGAAPGTEPALVSSPPAESETATPPFPGEATEPPKL